MRLASEVAAYKREHNLPVLNKLREREILARVLSEAGEMEPYAYQFFTTLMELNKARQTELYSPPSRVRALIEGALAAPEVVFPTAREQWPVRESRARTLQAAAINYFAWQHKVCEEL
jgi:chorismate mutase/prephenate dehydratase